MKINIKTIYGYKVFNDVLNLNFNKDYLTIIYFTKTSKLKRMICSDNNLVYLNVNGIACQFTASNQTTYASDIMSNVLDSKITKNSVPCSSMIFRGIKYNIVGSPEYIINNSNKGKSNIKKIYSLKKHQKSNFDKWNYYLSMREVTI